MTADARAGLAVALVFAIAWAISRLAVAFLRWMATSAQVGNPGGFDPGSLDYTAAELGDGRDLGGKL